MIDAEAGGSVSLSERLAFLADTGVITATARDLTGRAIAAIGTRLVPLNDDDAASLVTHIAMALTRVERGEPDVLLPTVAESELVDRADERLLAHELAGGWERTLGRSIPAAEIAYVALHLAALRDAHA